MANEEIDEQLNRLKNRKALKEKRSNKNQKILEGKRKKFKTREICSKKNIKKRRVFLQKIDREKLNCDPRVTKRMQ